MRARSSQAGPAKPDSILGCTSIGRDNSVVASKPAAGNERSGPRPDGDVSPVATAPLASGNPVEMFPGNLVSEELITLSEAARYCPRRRPGRKVHSSTLYRWATRGSRGVFLEVLDTPSGFCTSKQALGRFFVRLTAARNLPGRQPQTSPNLDYHEAVEAELARRFRI